MTRHVAFAGNSVLSVPKFLNRLFGVQLDLQSKIFRNFLVGHATNSTSPLCPAHQPFDPPQRLAHKHTFRIGRRTRWNP